MTSHEPRYHSFIVREGNTEYRVTILDALTLEYEQLPERCPICNNLKRAYKGIDICCNSECKMFHRI